MKGTSRTTRFASITSFALTIVLLLSGILIAAPPAHAVPTEPLGSPAVAPTEIGPPGSYAEGGIIVSLSKGGQHAARADALAGTLAALSKSEGTSGMILGGSGTVLEQEDGTCVSLVRFPQDVSVPRAIAEALKDPAVLSAEPNYLGTLCDDGQEAEPAEPPAPDEIETFGITNDPMLQVGQQWWHGTDKINSINAWDKAKTNGAVTVVVIDSGIRFDHQDLAANVDASRARSFIIDNNNRVEYIGPLAPSFGKGGDGGSSGHGTMVSGIVAATANNGLGGAGVSYNARILPVNVFPNGVNSVSSYSMIQALDYLTGLKTSGAVPSLKVANMSVQFIAAGPQFHAAVQRLRSAGVLPVAAAGNYGNDAPVYPSDWPEALSVTSIDQNDAFSDFSCHNYNKDIAAYGRGIWTTTNVDSTSYTSDYGTSFAAPMAAGAAALVFSLRPDFTPELVQSVLTSSSIDMGAEGKDPCFGHGRLRVSDAVKALTDPAPGNVVASGYYTMASSLGSSLVMDVDGASTANDAKVVSYTRNWTAAQLFQLVYNSSDGCYTVKNPHSSKVLDIPGNRAVEGQKLSQYTPNGTDAQRWRLIKNADGSFTLASNTVPSLCVNVPGGSKAPGKQLQLYRINGTAAQRFTLGQDESKALPAGTYKIATLNNTGQVLDVWGNATANGTNVQIYQGNKTPAQQFTAAFDAATGTYKLTGVGSGKPLDVDGGSTTPGANVQIYASNNTLAQRWRVEPLGSNRFRFYAAHSGLAMDAAAGMTANGTNVITWTPNGNNAQVWVLTKVA